MENTVRLFLQHVSDNAGQMHDGYRVGGYPSVLSGAPEEAVRLGFINEDSSNGSVDYALTDEGKKALESANAELGHHATRYVHKIKFFPGVGPTPYEAPFLVPLSTPTQRVMGTLCV